MKALIDGRVRTLTHIVGEGGEAVVYAVDTDRVAKISKDVCNTAKVQALMQAPLPACVVPPLALVHDATGSKVIGYTMARVQHAEPLSQYSRPDARANGFSANDALAVLQQMHADLRAIHRAGLLVGDFNDTNILLSQKQPRWIDADSYALPGLPCTVFSERYLDPRLMDATGGLAQPYDEASDWYAFCAVALELLLFVGPYSGVEPGKTLRDRIARRSTIFSPAVKRPKAMADMQSLPSDLVAALEGVIAGTDRTFDVNVLKGRVAHTPAPAKPSLPAPEFIIEVVGDRLLSRRAKAHPLLNEPLEIGTIVPERASVWLGSHFGLVVMRLSPLEGMGTLTMGAVFRPDRRGLLDGLRFPAIHGRIRELGCVFSENQAWLTYEREERGRRYRGCYVVSINAEIQTFSEETP